MTISWLKRKNLFQTFEQQGDEVEIEQDINDMKEFMDEDSDDKLTK